MNKDGYIVSKEEAKEGDFRAKCTPIVELTEEEQHRAIIYFNKALKNQPPQGVMAFGDQCGKLAIDFIELEKL